MSAIPFNPEPFEALKLRYPLAVADVLDMRDVPKLRPGQHPSALLQHNFHFENGLVMIVGRERHLDGRIGVHFSTSIHQPSETWDAVTAFPIARLALAYFVGLSENTWKALSGSKATPQFIGTSKPKGVPHFIAWET
jgi:hypothetical protein